MANGKGRRRRFGAIRQLPSGQWQARYRGPDGLMRSADTTFPTKTDAEVWLTRKEAEILNGDWINPDAGKVLLSDYGTAWIEERPTSGRRPSGCTATCSAATYSRTSSPRRSLKSKRHTCGAGARSSWTPV